MVEIYREHLRVVHDRRRPSVTRAALYFVAPRSLRCACRVVHISSDLRIFEHRDISVPCLSLSRVSDSRTEYFTCMSPRPTTLVFTVYPHYTVASQQTARRRRARPTCPDLGSCKSCPRGPLHRRERAYAGSPNMKVDDIGTLYPVSTYNSPLFLYTVRCLRGPRAS